MTNELTTTIENKIYIIRGQQVMIDRDIAQLYGVETRVLNQAVKRNEDRFPEEFCFQLDDSEFENWISQIVISNSEKMGLRKKPFAFTEQGVAMLSAVLKSETAVKMSIQIMKAFVAMRKFMLLNAQVFQRLDNIEKHQLTTDNKIEELFDRMDKYKREDKQEEKNEDYSADL